MEITWENLAHEFTADGALRDIYVWPTTIDDWQVVVDLILQLGSDICYTLDGRTTPCPTSAAAAFADSQQSSANLAFHVGGIRFSIHFFDPAEVELDFWPTDINCQHRLDMLLGFVRQIADSLGMPAFICPENVRDAPVIRCLPKGGGAVYTPWENLGRPG